MMSDRSISIASDLFDSTLTGLTLTMNDTPTPTPTPISRRYSVVKTPSSKDFEYSKFESRCCPATPFPTPRPAESIRSLRTPRPFPGYVRHKDTPSPFSRPPNPGGERIISLEELSKNTGESRSIWVGINNIVFDVSANKDIYGPGQVFNLFAGKDLTARANVSLFDLSHDLTPQLSFESDSLNAEQNRKLNTACLDIYNKKYPVIGRT